MSHFRMDKKTVRKLFGKIKGVVPVPNLIEIQSSSFNDFIQFDYLPEERQLAGLEKALRNVFPIEYEDKMSLEYVSYELGNQACTCGKLNGIEDRYRWHCSSCKKSGCSRLEQDVTCPKCTKNTARYHACANCLSRVTVKLPMSLDECRSSGQSFSMPLKIKVQLITWAKDEAENKTIRDVKEQDIFFADIPVMVDLYEEKGRLQLGNLGTFLINGVDRVIVSQLHRSPGVVFSQSKKVKDFRGQAYYLARIIPMRGSWLDFEFDSNDSLYVRIDKKKKLLITTFLQALGVARDQMLSLFYDFDIVHVDKGTFFRPVDDTLLGERIEKSMVPEKEAKTYAGKRVTKELLARLGKSGIKTLSLSTGYLLNKVIAQDLVDEQTGEV